MPCPRMLSGLRERAYSMLCPYLFFRWFRWDIEGEGFGCLGRSGTR
jgi:hypothetical protein